MLGQDYLCFNAPLTDGTCFVYVVCWYAQSKFVKQQAVT